MSSKIVVSVVLCVVKFKFVLIFKIDTFFNFKFKLVAILKKIIIKQKM